MKNPNDALPNRHTLYLARSGGGKSQALKQNTELPHSGVRCLLWDPGKDHDYRRDKTYYFDTRAGFGRAAMAAIRSGQGFRIAYNGPRTLGVHEWWCALVMSLLDGRHLTYVVDEEVAQSCQGAGEAPPEFATLLREGRKFGLVYHATSQRPQEVSKTVYENSEVIYVGPVATRTAKYMSEEMDVHPSVLKEQPDLTFHRLDPKAQPRVERIVHRYRSNDEF